MMIGPSKRKQIERYSTQGWSLREIAQMTTTPTSTVSRVVSQMAERKERQELAAKRGDLFARQRIDIGLDQIFFAMERIKTGRSADMVAVEIGVPVVILRQLAEGVLMIPFKGKTVAIKMERGRDREGALARALGMPAPEALGALPTYGDRRRAAAAAREAVVAPPPDSSPRPVTELARPALRLVGKGPQ